MLTVVPVVSVFPVTSRQHLSYKPASGHSRKVFSAPDEIVKLTDGLLGVLTTTAVHVAVEDTSEIS